MTEKPPTIERDWITASGLRAVCLIVPRGTHRCGYVAVPRDHPLYGFDYGDVSLAGIAVHGGLTWAADGSEISYPVPGDLWWFGFDCMHCYDAAIDGSINFGGEGVVRSQQYVEAELESLAQQLQAVATRRTSNAAD